MTVYNDIDLSLEGLIQGLNNNIEGRFCAKEEIGFGKPVFGYVGKDIDLYLFKLDVAKIVFDADLVTDNVVNGTVNTVTITPVTFDTDHDTTIALVVAAYGALTGVEAVLDSSDTDSRTILVRTIGSDNVSTGVVTLGAGQAGVVVTQHNGQVFMGVSTFVQNAPGVYELTDPVNVLTLGQISVKPIATVEANEDAFVDNAGAGQGSFSNAGQAVNCRYLLNTASGSYALLEVKGKTEGTYASHF